jgi:hypothetical protein
MARSPKCEGEVGTQQVVQLCPAGAVLRSIVESWRWRLQKLVEEYRVKQAELWLSDDGVKSSVKVEQVNCATRDRHSQG